MSMKTNIAALVLQTVFILVTLGIFVITTLATKGDIGRVESRLGRVESGLDRIEQNHLEHITRLHVQNP